MLQVRGVLQVAAMQILRKLRVAVTPRSALLQTTLSNGLVICGRNRAGYGGRGIYVYRESIEPEFEHLAAFLGSAGVFVDVGASVGIYTLKAAMHYRGGGVVIALEPFAEVFEALQSNVGANRLTNVRARRLCAAARSGRGTLWLNRGRPSLFSLARRIDGARGVSVETVALDDLLPREGIERVDYLKIDAEGAEEEILAGSRQTIERSRPIIQAEVGDRPFALALRAYSAFHADGSPNLVHLPDEHPKIRVAERLGWRRVPSVGAS